MYAALPPHMDRLSPGYEPVTSTSQGSNLTITPRLTLFFNISYVSLNLYIYQACLRDAFIVIINLQKRKNLLLI